MNEKVLFVDDEENILSSIKRLLRNQYDVDTALGPKAGLSALMENGPYAVIVSDLRMPEMDGIEFLQRTRQLAPDSVRVMLTGHADVNNAMEAINKGHIFRFLTKPAKSEELTTVLDLGLAQYRLITAEKELLEKTLMGSVEVMSDLLTMANPDAFSRAARIKRYVRSIANRMGLDEVWRFEIGTMLSQIGWITLPSEILNKKYKGQQLSDEEAQMFEMQPMISSDLVDHIPRLGAVSKMIAYQEKYFDGSGSPKDELEGEAIPIGARILKVALDFDLLEMKGLPKASAMMKLKRSNGKYDPEVLSALEETLGVEAKFKVADLEIPELREHMILGCDIRLPTGGILVRRGQELSRAHLSRLKMISDSGRIDEKIKVFIPLEL